MKSAVLVESILVGVLSVVGWTISSRTPPSGAEAAKSATASNLRLVFQRARGVGSQGELVDSESEPKARRIVAFLVRHASLGADLTFWRSVAGSLPAASGIQLIGYCDGDACAEALKAGGQSLAFPVIAYGEVVAAQAVVNADLQQAFVVAGDPLADPKAARWRAGGQTPADVAAELLK